MAIKTQKDKLNHCENYSINTELNSKSTINHKSSCNLLYFHKNVLKKYLTCSEIPKASHSPGSTLCQAYKSYAKQCWPGMCK